MSFKKIKILLAKQGIRTNSIFLGLAMVVCEYGVAYIYEF
jgi:hypothetical protein